jgi:hypothetical protein
MPNNNNTPYWESPTLERVFSFLNSGAGQKVSLAAAGAFALAGIASIATGSYIGAMASGAAMIKSLWTADHGIGIKSPNPDFSSGLSCIAAIIFGAATGAGQLITYQLTPIENAPHVRSLPEMKGVALTERAALCQKRRGWIEVEGKKLECF